MNLDLMMALQHKPEPFAPGDALFWDDPYISAQLLKAHLDPGHDRASRRPETVQRSVDWLVAALGLRAGDAVLDLGCGPGLYAARLARHGMRVTGVDYSRRSIDYAIEQAAAQRLDIAYRCQNYLTLDDEGLYDAALLIYGDFCPLAPEQRRALLANVRRALRPGGHFVLDVTTRIHRQRHGSRNRWYAAAQGFWRAGPHLVLEEGFDYPEQAIFLDQVVVIEPNDHIALYRMWFQDFSRETITRELAQAGFAIAGIWGDLLGTPFSEGAEWIGLIARPHRL